MIDKTEEGEVCTPTLENECKEVVLTYKKVVLNEKCNTITTTKCNEVNEEEEAVCVSTSSAGQIRAPVTPITEILNNQQVVTKFFLILQNHFKLVV